MALLFEAHKDLLTEFTYFLPDNTAPERAPARVPAIPISSKLDELMLRVLLRCKLPCQLLTQGDKGLLCHDTASPHALRFSLHWQAHTPSEWGSSLTSSRLRRQAPAKRGTGRGRVGGRPVTEQGVLRNLNKRKSARRGDDYDGAAQPFKNTHCIAQLRAAVNLSGCFFVVTTVLHAKSGHREGATCSTPAPSCFCVPGQPDLGTVHVGLTLMVQRHQPGPPDADPAAGHAEEDAHLARSNLAKELQFFERVKTKLRSREAYQDLLKCLNMFAQEITSRDEMLAMVNDLLGRMPELMARS